MNFYKLYGAGRVKRYHTTDIPAQSLAAHSWGVALIVTKIYPKPMEPTGRLLMAALTHDLAESETGDIPAPLKWKSRSMDSLLDRLEKEFNVTNGIDWDLTQAEKRLLQWADTFELCLYCSHCAYLGNREAEATLKRGLGRLLEIGYPSTEAAELFADIYGD